jgi:putative ABC transport system substrate-binding protein
MSQVRRRQFLLAVGAGSLLVLLPALAQQEKRVRRIGFFVLSGVQDNAARLAAFRASMAELRWIEGRDYVIDARYANGVAQDGPDLAAELLATRPDLLLTNADDGVRLLAQRTKTIPIVFAIAQDPVGNGNVASLRHPGGNATGLTSLSTDLGAKRLQLLKEAFPRVAHVVLLFEPDSIGSVSQVKEIEEAARRLRIRVSPIELRKAADIDPAFQRGAALGAHAYIVYQGGLANAQRQAIDDRVLRAKVPAIFYNSEVVEAGGLMSYGPSPQDNFRLAAGYVDKILKGANPGDLPIEQPTKFELVVNMKTAKAMGLKFPQSFLLRADRVIE